MTTTRSLCLLMHSPIIAAKRRGNSSNLSTKGIRMAKKGAALKQFSLQDEHHPRSHAVGKNNLAPANANDRTRAQLFSATRIADKNENGNSGADALQQQSVQELQKYALSKAQQTTATTTECLRIAENIKQDASETLVTLHRQGEQITRTHLVAVDMERELSRGEKLLGSLGGLFSRTWKPEKNKKIKGPVITSDSTFRRKAKHMEQRKQLGLNDPKRTSDKTYVNTEDTLESNIEVEKAKQDDALSDLSNVLDQLKEMAIDMSSEIERQNVALDPLNDDITELSARVEGARVRGRRLLGK